MHNALVDFRTQTTYETATDSVVHATHLDAVAGDADTTENHTRTPGEAITADGNDDGGGDNGELRVCEIGRLAQRWATTATGTHARTHARTTERKRRVHCSGGGTRRDDGVTTGRNEIIWKKKKNYCSTLCGLLL